MVDSSLGPGHLSKGIEPDSEDDQRLRQVAPHTREDIGMETADAEQPWSSGTHVSQSSPTDWNLDGAGISVEQQDATRMDSDHVMFDMSFWQDMGADLPLDLLPGDYASFSALNHDFTSAYDGM